MSPALRLKSAVSLVGRFPALAGVDLEVAPGEIVLVEGGNGAGKTTLLRACAGLVPVVAGEAEVLGFDLRRDRRTVRRHVALLGHDSALYDDLTVEENLAFAGRAGGVQERPVVPDTALALLDLDRLRGVVVARLSAGQRRRVAVAALLSRRHARVWLLDEPHAALDAAGRDVLDALVSEAAGRQVAVVVASHEAERARPLAHRVVTLAGGRVVSAERLEKEAAGVA